MKVLRAQDQNEFIKKATDWTRQNSAPGNLVFLPAGNTPISIYQSWELEKPPFLKSLRFQQVDEIIKGQKVGLFKNFFEAHLPTYQKQFRTLGDEPLQGDLAILGVGENGHVAFHEPDIPVHFNYGCVPLSNLTKKHLEITEDSHGLTYGLGTFLKVKHILLLGSGLKKKILLKELIEEKSKESIVGQFYGHNDVTLLLDSEMSLVI